VGTGKPNPSRRPTRKSLSHIQTGCANVPHLAARTGVHEGLHQTEALFTMRHTTFREWGTERRSPTRSGRFRSPGLLPRRRSLRGGIPRECGVPNPTRGQLTARLASGNLVTLVLDKADRESRRHLTAPSPTRTLRQSDRRSNIAIAARPPGEPIQAAPIPI